jgi:hypothetical protein
MGVKKFGAHSQHQFQHGGSQMQRMTSTAAYDGRILKLRLPEQDLLKNDAERCSADPAGMASIGCAVGRQVRIRRRDDSRFHTGAEQSRPS